MSMNAQMDQYTRNKILTATPAELTLMLYDGAIKFCNIAILGIEQGSIQKAHDNIMKVQRIIEEFQITLNFDYAIANDYNNVYNYLIKRLREANMTKNKAVLEEVSKHLHTLRDAWKEVMKRQHSAAV
ncbi:MAG: flagellar export chaperone FliS [Lachnospiraceae bacterium]|nr:flagellar export chaperone FliS [Lachnospiraceae bacterium]